MFQNTRRLMPIAALVAAPLALFGCGGGGNSSPFGTTPTATPTPSVISFKLDARYSRAVGGLGLPPDATYSTGLGQFYTQNGYNVFSPSFGDSTIGISVSKIGAIKTGDSFIFSPNSATGDIRVNSAYLNYPANVSPRPSGGTINSRSGTLRIVSLVNNAAGGNNLPTATVKFTLSDVVFGESDRTGSVTLNATGECTLQNFGDLFTQAK